MGDPDLTHHFFTGVFDFDRLSDFSCENDSSFFESDVKILGSIYSLLSLLSLDFDVVLTDGGMGIFLTGSVISDCFDFPFNFVLIELVFTLSETIFALFEVVFVKFEDVFATFEVVFAALEVVFATFEVVFATFEVVFATLEVFFATFEVFFELTESECVLTESVFPLFDVFGLDPSICSLFYKFSIFFSNSEFNFVTCFTNSLFTALIM